MFLFWPSLILAVYVVCSGVLPLKIHWFWKLLSAAVIFLISMKYMAYTMNGGTFFEPAVKGAWMLTWEALYGALILAAFLLLRLSENSKIKGDAAIALIASSSVLSA